MDAIPAILIKAVISITIIKIASFLLSLADKRDNNLQNALNIISPTVSITQGKYNRKLQ